MEGGEGTPPPPPRASPVAQRPSPFTQLPHLPHLETTVDNNCNCNCNNNCCNRQQLHCCLPLKYIPAQPPHKTGSGCAHAFWCNFCAFLCMMFLFISFQSSSVFCVSRTILLSKNAPPQVPTAEDQLLEDAEIFPPTLENRLLPTEEIMVSSAQYKHVYVNLQT